MEADLLSIMLTAESLQGQDEMIKDEIFGFFLAGMKTIQMTTTNLIYYMAKHTEYRDKLFKEILPPLEKVSDNIKDGLEYDTVQEFDYLSHIFSETMRIEAPVAGFNPWEPTQDVVIGSGDKAITIKKGWKIMLYASELHHDPKIWHEPTVFNPDRFNKDSEWFKQPDGKPRDNLAYMPFMGGKRVCLGKTLAETIFRFTIPIIFHHLRFEFVDPAQAKSKEYYAIGG